MKKIVWLIKGFIAYRLIYVVKNKKLECGKCRAVLCAAFGATARRTVLRCNAPGLWKNLASETKCLVSGLVLIAVAGTASAYSSAVACWDVTPTSLVAQGTPAKQNINLEIQSVKALTSCVLKVWTEGNLLAEKALGALPAGTNIVSVLLDEPGKPVSSRWTLSVDGSEMDEKSFTWEPPRHWQLYVIKSSHIDIGLHDSQFKQRYLADRNLDDACGFAEKTSDWPEASRFRYVVEGLWWWLNYVQDRPGKQVDQLVERYCKSGVFGIGASHSGNRTEVYSAEELCRSTYCVQQVRARWNLPMDTMLMVDNNGLTWPLVTAYADAGIKYAGFFVNAWNPGAKDSALGWSKKGSRDYVGAGGERGGSRIDVGWESDLPHLFYWRGADKQSRLLVWTCPTYTSAGHDFGLNDPNRKVAEVKMLKRLAQLERKYPYDTWVIPFYNDNESPGLSIPSYAKAWNALWRWPEIRTVGDLSVPFHQVESRFGDKIPVLSGMITAGWAQHPVSTPSLLAAKREADRLLPVAEKLATIARLTDPEYIYPSLEFRRAWDGLICNDEHGYGVSSYSGRKVFDTWMQKRDWIARARHTAETESKRALESLAAKVSSDGVSILVFNPTLQSRDGYVEVELPQSFSGNYTIRTPKGQVIQGVVQDGKLKFVAMEVPSMGYARFKLLKGDGAAVEKQVLKEPPVLENKFYRVKFGADGAITAIYDKQLNRELVDAGAPYQCNQFVYSADGNKTFTTPSGAEFEVVASALETTVIATLNDAATKAEIIQKVTLPAHEKRIDIDNLLNHVSDLGDSKRYNSCGYFAFPFDVPQGWFRIGLNGCNADALKDQTGLGTDTYHAARDWTYVGNGKFGVSLVQLDSMLVECGRIHSMKNTIGDKPENSHIYSYIFNDWLFSHAYVTGPSHINLRYRYVISSHSGGFAESGVEQLAGRICTPLLATVIVGVQKESLPSDSHSFLSTDAPGVNLLALKMSEKPGGGVIARFHENNGKSVEKAKLKLGWGSDLRFTSCSVSEQDRGVIKRAAVSLSPFGYDTLRIEENGKPPSPPSDLALKVTEQSISLSWNSVRNASQYNVYRGEKSGFAADACHLLTTTSDSCYTDSGLKSGATYYYCVSAVDASMRQGESSFVIKGTTLKEGDSAPSAVGSHYTGLISDVRAWRGVEPDLLYLQWGQNMESDLSHYELYRGESPDFILDEKTFVAKVEPGPYVTVPYEDKGLKAHTAYYYRVLAVDRDGNKSEPGEMCVGMTHEMGD